MTSARNLIAVLAVLMVGCRPTRPPVMPSDQTAAELARLERIATEVLRLDLGPVEQKGAERNMLGLRSASVLVSRRRDSRTYFVEDARYGKDAYVASAVSDAELVDEARRIVRQLNVPAEEIDDATVMTEKLQTGRIDPQTHRVTPGEVRDGKRYVQLGRKIHGVPVFSSRALVALARQKRVGFLQLHWPEVPETTVREAERLQAVVRKGWRPPEQKSATVESVEAGIIHSPAIGFVMDIHPAIRVIYKSVDQKLGRKLMLHLDERGNPVPIPRQFEKSDEPPPPPRTNPKEKARRP